MSPAPWEGARPRAARFPPRVARAIVARDEVCQLQYAGCTVDAEEADHVIGWAQAAALGWTVEQFNDPGNGQGVCPPCHARKTQAQASAGRARAKAERPKARPKRRHPAIVDDDS